MEDYIFLFIAILLSIFGALNQNKKKRMQEDAPDEPRHRVSPADPFLNFELMDVEDEEEAYERKAREKADREDYLRSVEAKKAQTYQPSQWTTSLPDRPKKKVIKPALKVIELDQPAAVTEQDTSTGILEDFSLRKAVIYAEILKRKY